MIKPEEVKNLDNYNLDNIEKEIDQSIVTHHGWYSWEVAILDKEYPLEIRNEIARRYKDNGWKYVYHRTSSENGERAGLTQFIFSMTKIKFTYIKNGYCI